MKPQTNEKRRPGGKLSRSETVTVRLDPKLRYLSELAARKQRRTLSSFIEWTIEQALAGVEMTTPENEASNLGDAKLSLWLWDVDEADRLVKLAIAFPDLLTYDEQRVWKILSESTACKEGVNDRDLSKMDLAKVRRNWSLAQQLAAQGRTATEFDSQAT